MSRKEAFKEALVKALTINDSRFGKRTFFVNTEERPRIATNMLPGKGVSGEHQN